MLSVKNIGWCLLILSALGLLVIFTLWITAMLIPSQVNWKLGDFNGDSIHAVLFSPPNCKKMYLVIGIKKGETIAGQGEVEIFEQNILKYKYTFNSDALTQCNWLENESLNGLIIAWAVTDKNKSLENIIRQNKTYEIFVKIPKTENTSLWLSGVR